MIKLKEFVIEIGRYNNSPGIAVIKPKSSNQDDTFFVQEEARLDLNKLIGSLVWIFFFDTEEDYHKMHETGEPDLAYVQKYEVLKPEMVRY